MQLGVTWLSKAKVSSAKRVLLYFNLNGFTNKVTTPRNWFLKEIIVFRW